LLLLLLLMLLLLVLLVLLVLVLGLLLLLHHHAHGRRREQVARARRHPGRGEAWRPSCPWERPACPTSIPLSVCAAMGQEVVQWGRKLFRDENGILTGVGSFSLENGIAFKRERDLGCGFRCFVGRKSREQRQMMVVGTGVAA